MSLQHARDTHTAARTALQAAKMKFAAIEEKSDELETELQALAGQLVQAQATASEAMKKWTDGESDQSDVTTARRAVSDLERRKAELTDLHEALGEQVASAQGAVETAQEAVRKAAAAYWGAIEEDELAKAAEASRVHLVRAYLASRRSPHVFGRVRFDEYVGERLGKGVGNAEESATLAELQQEHGL